MLTKHDVEKARDEGYAAFSENTDLRHENPYYPGSNRHDAFIEGWKVAEFEKTFKQDCPWRSRVICLVSRNICMMENCGLWYLKNKMGGDND